MFLGFASLLILLIMKLMSKNISSPTVKAEILGWKLDVCYSLGMSFAFFISMQLKHTPLAFLSPYFDQLIAIVIMLFMIPESIKMLLETFRELLLFSPDQETVDQIKQISEGILKDYAFTPVFYDISRTGRKMWVAIYFHVSAETLSVQNVREANHKLNTALMQSFPDVCCELVLDTADF